MKKGFLILVCLLCASAAWAGPSVIDFTDSLVSMTNKAVYAQVQTPNPLLSIQVADNLSHTLTISSIVTAPNTAMFMNMAFNGSGTCYVRLMNNTTRGSWPQYTVPAGTNFGRGIHPNTLYFHYSSCFL